MCCTSTLQEIERQAKDKARIKNETILSLSQRFVSPVELLTRYYDFHTNAEALIRPDTLEYEIHAKRSKEFEAVLEAIKT